MPSATPRAPVASSAPANDRNTASAPAISSLATSLEAMRSRSLSISSQEHGSRGIEL